MTARVANKKDRQRPAEEGTGNAEIDRHRAKAVTGGEIAGQECRHADEGSRQTR
jgi:hypothetical protein